MMAWIAFQIYRWLLFPLCLLILKILRPFIQGKLRTILDERHGLQWPALSARPVWIHASSGEIEYAKPVIRSIKERYPHIPILVSYFSPSAKRLLKDFPGVDFVIASPLDSMTSVRSYLKKFNPVAIMYSRTDVWPELATQARQAAIPQILFAATLSENSSRVRFPMKFLSQWTFQQMNEIHCVSNEDLQQFHNLGLDIQQQVQVQGDTRYDQVLYRLVCPKKIKITRTKEPTFIAGSTWPADEEVLLPALRTWNEQKGKIILAPHEVRSDRIQKLQQNLSRLNLKSQLYSEFRTEQQTDVLIIDEIGILPEIYQCGDLAFVGGSFKDKVHSVMEPLACGLPVLVGPFHKNNREALQFQSIKLSSGLNPVQAVKNTQEIIDFFSQWPQQKSDEIKNQIKTQVQKKSGASEKLISFLSANLGPLAKS